HYKTQWGQFLVLTTNLKDAAEIPLTHNKNGHWTGTLERPQLPPNFSYNYELRDANGTLRAEQDYARTLPSVKGKDIRLNDAWRAAESPETALYASAFEDVLFQPNTASKASNPRRSKGKVKVHFQTLQVRVPQGTTLGIAGNTASTGDWGKNGVLPLGSDHFPLWHTAINAAPGTELSYKYVLLNSKTQEITAWETGDNRSLSVPTTGDTFVQTDTNLRLFDQPWKGSGVALPVFSLRTAKSSGCGEFSDLRGLVDWAKQLGMQMVQILPVNDTVAKKNWVDSYPYAAISVFALHPMYLCIHELETVINAPALKKRREELNASPTVDYEAVMEHKVSYARKVYNKVRKEWVVSKGFQQFFRENKHWLRPYAAFCYLRDQYGTANFNEWKTHQVYDEKEVEKLTDPKSKAYVDIAFHYYLQYHLDKQLASAADYARSQGIVLKGDIAIGILRDSADAWTEPHLYNMDGQAGAPPDDFAKEGQNWGFPTYRWDVMAEDGYQWWRNRFTQLSRYFDAFRIDHILGFFRIWETPIEQMEGIMGRFNPAIPIRETEFHARGIYFDEARFCLPFITWGIAEQIFGEHASYVIEHFCEPFYDRLQLREEFKTQRQLAEALTDEQQHLKKGLFDLVSNMLFFKVEDEHGAGFHPRISLRDTWSFRVLDNHLQDQIQAIHDDYFYRRQDDFWREQGMTKLPAIKAATNMLICGEDLGMVPDCVPPVMKELGILTLEIQRMAKNPKTPFLHVNDIPYWSVCSPSTHDMEPIRLWWEVMEPHRRQAFYNNELGWWGEAPAECPPELAEAILRMHLGWPTMWTVFPIQDLLAMDGKLRHPDPHFERINIPANIPHYWNYRLHLSVEELQNAEYFNQRLGFMLRQAGRSEH
ncbi:MAG: 4-alpha-glucanotransferase, partial [Bacteroidota bacterium]